MSQHEQSTQPTDRQPARARAPGDPAPLTAPQLRALGAAALRELAWGLPQARREINRWQADAQTIESPPIREDALRTIATKRGHIDGAVLFTILPRRRNLHLLRLLVAYELIWDLLDTVNEHGTRAGAGQDNGRQLHLALIDAADERRPIADYYRHHPWKADSGYLRALVLACRRHARRLPSYQKILPHVLTESHRTQVLAINHETDHCTRDAALRTWASDHAAGRSDTTWYELSGAASASLTIHALFALAADPVCTQSEIDATRAAYFPWVSAATTMLDSYVDQLEDLINNDHSYIRHYPSSDVADTRIADLLACSFEHTSRLPRAHQHALIIACMTAMYLSKDSARTPATRDTTTALLAAGGTLTRRLQPILRAWRILNTQQAS